MIFLSKLLWSKMSQQQAPQGQPQTSQAGDASLRALQFALQTTINAKKLKAENEQLKLKLKENEQLLSDFDDAAPRAKSLKAQLKEKEQKLCSYKTSSIRFFTSSIEEKSKASSNFFFF